MAENLTSFIFNTQVVGRLIASFLDFESRIMAYEAGLLDERDAFIFLRGEKPDSNINCAVQLGCIIYPDEIECSTYMQKIMRYNKLSIPLREHTLLVSLDHGNSESFKLALRDGPVSQLFYLKLLISVVENEGVEYLKIMDDIKGLLTYDIATRTFSDFRNTNDYAGDEICNDENTLRRFRERVRRSCENDYYYGIVESIISNGECWRYLIKKNSIVPSLELRRIVQEHGDVDSMRYLQDYE